MSLASTFPFEKVTYVWNKKSALSQLTKDRVM